MQLDEYEEQIDERWHLLMIEFKLKKKLINSDKHEMLMYIDDLSKPIKRQATDYTFPKKQSFSVSYG